jgi:hypothetical protein
MALYTADEITAQLLESKWFKELDPDTQKRVFISCVRFYYVGRDGKYEIKDGTYGR